jgi:predicted dehydrogenase
MDKLKFAIAGCGSVSGNRYFPNLGDLSRGWLAAVCDSVAERAKCRSEEFQVPGYTDLDEMLAKTDFDLLVNLTNIQSHFQVSLKALQAGKHVYVQKPMTVAVAEATRLIDEAAERGLKLVAEESAGLNPYYIAIRKVIEDGVIGKVVWVRSVCTHCGPAAIDNWPTDPTWFYQKGAGPLLDVGIERLHLLTFLLGPARRVTAMSGIRQPEVVVRTGPCQGKRINVEEDDITLVTLDFGDSLFAMLDTVYVNFEAYRAPDLEIYGTKGVIASFGESHAQRLWLYQCDPESGIRGWQELQLIPQATQLPSLRIVGLAHAIDCVVDGTEPIPSGEHARHCIDIIEKAYAAARTGFTQQVTTVL